jgi:2'-hydroxyisoflavone reductase
MTTRRELLKLSALAGMTAYAASALAHESSMPTKRSNKPLRILILGGTGFTGPHQVRYALARGHKVTLFNRGKRPQQWPGEVEELLGDRAVGDLKSLKDRQWDVCIDNPTSVPHWVRDAGHVLKKNVGHYIFISTISVYADNSKPGADERAAVAAYTGNNAMAETRDTLAKDMSLYGPLKALCEVEAQKQFKEKTTIIRPGLIVGPGDETDRFSYWPVRIARGGEVLAPDAQDPVQWIDARDLAEWTIRMAESRTLGTFNATGPDYEMSMAAMLYGIRAVTTKGAQLTFVPADFLASQKVEPWRDMPVWVPGSGDSAGFARISVSKALAAGLTYRSLASTASDTLTWWQTQPRGRQEKLRAGLTPEREREVLKAWRAKNTTSVG